MAATSSNHAYERLEEPADDSEATRLLEPLFDKLRERLTTTAPSRPPNSGILAALSVGSGEQIERWLIDTRDGVPPDAAITRAATSLEAPTISLHVPEPTDLLALLERRLPPFRALAQRRIVLSGDLSALRSMTWLLAARHQAVRAAARSRCACYARTRRAATASIRSMWRRVPSRGPSRGDGRR